MTRHSERTPRRLQRGWVGLVVLLLALVIVAMLAKDALKEYGMLGGSPAAAQTQGGTAAASGGTGGAVDPGTASAPAVAAPIERARAVEGTLRQQAEDAGKRIDDATR